MTDLERNVKELRDKYEKAIRKYLAAYYVLHEAILAENGHDRLMELTEFCERSFPYDAVVATRCVIGKMDYIDQHEDKYDVWKESLVNWIDVWKTQMDLVRI